MANVFQNIELIFLLLSISGIVKAGINTFYKYECEYKICLLHMIQSGFCKLVRKILLETLKPTFEEIHV